MWCENNIADRNFALRLLRGAQLNRFYGLRNGGDILRPIGRNDGVYQVSNFFIDLIPVNPFISRGSNSSRT